ncbi:hypothetical protein RHA1_ro04185 [Rhodococcus jostii RHA1]|uniref:Uncharacterized protein n=1 Tax=Rhodococcus jostii (strain RHA1) TaxID=101510 RepID=Q0S908_RHOJR|nr:hypothetical protein RHA1_ro04185 [Rhodococcus jostii RHA1]
MDHEVEAVEAVDGLAEVGAAEVPVVLAAHPGRIVQDLLHAVARGRPGGYRVFVDGRRHRQFQIDDGDDVALRVDHVPHDVAGRPAVTRGRVVPAFRGHGFDALRELRGKVAVMGCGGFGCRGHAADSSPVRGPMA